MPTTIKLPLYNKFFISLQPLAAVERFLNKAEEPSRPGAFLISVNTVLFNINAGFKPVLIVLLDILFLGCYCPWNRQTIATAPLI